MSYFLSIWIVVANCIVFGSFAYADEQLAVVDDKAKEEVRLTPEQMFRASLKEDMVVGYFTQYWLPINEFDADGYYRKIVKVMGNDSFLVQDFFAGSNKKQSDPVLINSVYELKRNGVLRSIEGPYVTWYESGQKQYELHYKKVGILDGEIKGWYDNGIKKVEGQYQNGKKTGQWLEWYSNNRIKSRINYSNNMLDGAYNQWYENGKQQAVGQYSLDKLVGLWIMWDGKGNKLSEGIYVDGKRMGPWTYYTDGKKWAEGSYVGGLQDGLWVYWQADGKKAQQIVYQKGKKVGK